MNFFPLVGMLVEHSIAGGNPARIQSRVGEGRGKLQEEGNKARCPECSMVYELAGWKCSPLLAGEEK